MIPLPGDKFRARSRVWLLTITAIDLNNGMVKYQMDDNPWPYAMEFRPFVDALEAWKAWSPA
jgi:hypothetical protein